MSLVCAQVTRPLQRAGSALRTLLPLLSTQPACIESAQAATISSRSHHSRPTRSAISAHQHTPYPAAANCWVMAALQKDAETQEGPPAGAAASTAGVVV